MACRRTLVSLLSVLAIGGVAAGATSSASAATSGGGAQYCDAQYYGSTIAVTCDEPSNVTWRIGIACRILPNQSSDWISGTGTAYATCPLADQPLGWGYIQQLS